MEHLEAIRRDSDAFYATADHSDPTRPVPSCPDWTIADLVWHLAEVHWFWASVAEMRATNPDDVEQAKPPRPDAYADVIAFGRAQVDRIIEVLAATPGDTGVWTWALDVADHNVAFISRHQVQEAAVHRWDIQNAAGATPDPIDATAASDSIDELLAITLPWSVRADKTMPGTVHIHCTDTEGEWFIHGDGRVEWLHAKGDAAIRGTASDLLLALYSRVPLDAVDVIGDEDLAHTLVERISTD